MNAPGPDPTARLLSGLARVLQPLATTAEVRDRITHLSEPEPLQPTEHPGLARAARCWGLSAWELDLLRFAAAADLDGSFVSVFTALGGATLELAMTAHEINGALRPHGLSAFLPGAPLMRLGILQPLGESRLLRLTDGLWAHLTALPSLQPCAALHPIATGMLHLSETTRAQLASSSAGSPERPPLCFVVGHPGCGRHAVATAWAAGLGLATLEVQGHRLDDPCFLAQLERDARWWSAAIVVMGPANPAAIVSLHHPTAWVMQPTDTRPTELAARRTVLHIDVPALSPEAREAVWRDLLGPGIDAGRMARRFRLGPGRITEAVTRARQRTLPLTTAAVEAACNEVVTAAFGPLAQRIDSPARWEDLVTSEAVRDELALAVAWLDHGGTVFQKWGMGRALTGSLGMVALLAGPPGTGKTLASRVLANALGMQLWRVDLSRTVDKYLGESEKNLGRIFDAAREGNVLLLFDEAEAVFGRRTDVHDAHDRHANLQTGYLLQRLEEHDGPVLLASNLPENLDEAFQRRIHITARFELPDREQRKAIWALHLPHVDYQSGPIELDVLAQFEIAGGDIRNAALAGALLAASEGSHFTMAHAVRGLVREIRKSGRMIDLSRFGPWRSAI